MNSSKRDPVILIHGIRTEAKWQKDLGDALGKDGFRHDTHDYGRFRLHRFLWPPSRAKRIEAFYDWYSGIRQLYRAAQPKKSDYRPNVVAHSLGTYIVGYGMKKFPDLRFGRIVFCGSILPRDFDWVELFGRGQVVEVLNDYGVQDVWAHIVQRVVRDTGSAGSDGFAISSPLIRQRRFEHFKHSDYFRPGHYGQWIEFLREPTVRVEVVRSSAFPAGQEWKAIALKMRAIDKAVFEGVPQHTTVALPQGLSTRWIEEGNPDIYTILADNAHRVHGYINAMPVTPKAFDEIVSGKRLDPQIEPSHIVPYVDDSVIDIYLMSIAIDPTSRRLSDGTEQSAFHRLIFGYTHHLAALARERRIFVRRMCAICWTLEGKRLCELLGMTERNPGTLEHPVFVLELSANDARPHRLLRDLRRTYAQLRGGDGA